VNGEQLGQGVTLALLTLDCVGVILSAKMPKHDTCEFCEGKIEQRVVQARFHFKGQIVFIDGVPAWVCVKCGEQYFDAPVYKRLEEIAKHSDHIKKTICFPLAEYDMAMA
jgi:YgiT-type zinc finger domain-containing protein